MRKEKEEILFAKEIKTLYKKNGITYFIGEFWTAKQKQSCSLHEIPYRACFKAEVPRYFITKFSGEEDVVYDPFAGRGTTGIEAALLKREVVLNDINPLTLILAKPRFFIPSLEQVKKRLDFIFNSNHLQEETETSLAMFFHEKNERELLGLRSFFEKNLTPTDEWIRMIATARLAGHSKGYFSIYTLPPNQSVSIAKQMRINEMKKQKPVYKDIKNIIIEKSKNLFRNVSEEQFENLKRASEKIVFLKGNAYKTPELKNDSVDLIVTSPPFLNVVSYDKDNWLRCWFNNIDLKKVKDNVSMFKKLTDWKKFIFKTLKELHRVLKTNKYLILEVGEVRKGKIKLDEEVAPLAMEVGFEIECVLINRQTFTKTANIWGVKNNQLGTNTNRLLILKK